MDVWRVHAQYYAAITFNQIVLSTAAADRSAARKLIDVYFHLFREVVGGREPEPVDDVTHTKEELNDKGKEQIKRKKRPQNGEVKNVRGATGFMEVQDENSKLPGAILTGSCLTERAVWGESDIRAVAAYDSRWRDGDTIIKGPAPGRKHRMR